MYGKQGPLTISNIFVRPIRIFGQDPLLEYWPNFESSVVVARMNEDSISNSLIGFYNHRKVTSTSTSTCTSTSTSTSSSTSTSTDETNQFCETCINTNNPFLKIYDLLILEIVYFGFSLFLNSSYL